MMILYVSVISTIVLLTLLRLIALAAEVETLKRRIEELESWTKYLLRARKR